MLSVLFGPKIVEVHPFSNFLHKSPARHAKDESNPYIDAASLASESEAQHYDGVDQTPPEHSIIDWLPCCLQYQIELDHLHGHSDVPVNMPVDDWRSPACLASIFEGIDVEIGKTGVFFSMKFFFYPTFNSLLFISLAILSYRVCLYVYTTSRTIWLLGVDELLDRLLHLWYLVDLGLFLHETFLP